MLRVGYKGKIGNCMIYNFFMVKNLNVVKNVMVGKKLFFKCNFYFFVF